MTGRRLYDRYADALVYSTSEWARSKGHVGQLPTEPKAWPVLSSAERSVWNDLARRVTPKPRKR